MSGVNRLSAMLQTIMRLAGCAMQRRVSRLSGQTSAGATSHLCRRREMGAIERRDLSAFVACAAQRAHPIRRYSVLSIIRHRSTPGTRLWVSTQFCGGAGPVQWVASTAETIWKSRHQGGRYFCVTMISIASSTIKHTSSFARARENPNLDKTLTFGPCIQCHFPNKKIIWEYMPAGCEACSSLAFCINFTSRRPRGRLNLSSYSNVLCERKMRFRFLGRWCKMATWEASS
jgi:hypothetical protein